MFTSPTPSQWALELRMLGVNVDDRTFCAGPKIVETIWLLHEQTLKVGEGGWCFRFFTRWPGGMRGAY